MSVAESQPAVPGPKRRWFQFSRQSLLFVILCCTLFSVSAGWLARKQSEAERQREAATAIETVGGAVIWGKPSALWVQRLLGYDTFNSVEQVQLSFTKVNDSDLANLEGFSHLDDLFLDGTQVTDAGLLHLGGLRHLQQLSLRDTKVTDAGVTKLQQTLPNCKIIR